MTNGGTRRRWRLLAALVVVVVVAAACEAVPNDYTGDRTSDLVYRDTNDNWYVAGQTAPLYTGNPYAIAVPGDYDGDLEWEPAELNGTTWTSSALATPIDYDPAGMPTGPAATLATGQAAEPTLVPVPGDYDGNGKTVPAYYDQVDGTWWIMGHDQPIQFGNPPVTGGIDDYDVPVPADYDGDHKTDIAIFRPSDGSFHYLSSKTGQVVVVQAGSDLDFPVPQDYDKVGHAEPAVADANFEHWYLAGSTTPMASFDISWQDWAIPTFGDYNGDGHADPAVWDMGSTDTWLVAGEGAVATMPVDGYGGSDVEMPPWLLVNMVRLTLYHHCLGNPASTPPGTC